MCVLMLLKSSILSPSLAIPFLSFLVAPIHPPFVDMVQEYRKGRCGSCRLQSLLWSALFKVQMVGTQSTINVGGCHYYFYILHLDHDC